MNKLNESLAQLSLKECKEIIADYEYFNNHCEMPSGLLHNIIDEHIRDVVLTIALKLSKEYIRSTPEGNLTRNDFVISSSGSGWYASTEINGFYYYLRPDLTIRHQTGHGDGHNVGLFKSEQEIITMLSKFLINPTIIQHDLDVQK